MSLEGLQLNEGSGGEVLATDKVSGQHFPVTKLGIGVDDSQPTSVSSAAPLPVGDPFLDIARGLVTGISHVNKFGSTDNADIGITTDLWDNSGTTVIWVAPTQARTHQIKSSSTDDDGSPVGIGARTIRIFGLKTWSTNESSEDIVMNGTTNVPTANTYVIIHRMEVLTKGATSENVGVITATADTDNSITAQINADKGQTEMAIYGIPDTQVGYMTEYYASVIKTTSALSAEIDLVFNQEPDVELKNFIVKNDFGLETGGTTYATQTFKPYLRLAGPGIVKLEANANKTNTVVSGGFDIILVNN